MNKKFYPINRILPLLLVLGMTLGPVWLRAQACKARAGSLAVDPATICPDTPFELTLRDANETGAYTSDIFITNSDGIILQTGLSPGLIDGLPAGIYRLHTVNYQESDTFEPPAVGKTLADITGDEQDCYDISAALVLEIGDPVAPVAVCTEQTVLLYLDETGMLGLNPKDFDFGSYDEGCIDITGFQLDREIFSCADLGSQQVELTVVDGLGNMDECTTNIEVLDSFPPVLECQPALEVELSALGIVEISPSDVLKEVADACDPDPGLQLDRTLFDCSDIGTSDQKLYARDSRGNRDSCTFSLIVKDVTGPIMSCQSAAVFLDNRGLAGLDPADLDAGSRDLCGGSLEFFTRPAILDCMDLGVQQVKLFGRDPYGNLDSCTASVSVLDTVKPQAICANLTVYLDSDGMFTITPEQVDRSTDNCGIEDRTLERIHLDCEDLGLQKISLEVRDFAGNSAQCVAEVNVLDTIAPKAQCRQQSIYLDENGIARVTASQVNAGSTDNCGTITAISLDRSRFFCTDLGQSSVELRAVDPSGNQGTCTTSLWVRDTIAPKMACRDTVVYLSEEGMATIDPAWVDKGTVDNCLTAPIQNLDRYTFDCSDLGVSEVTLKAEDASGNAAVCRATVEVRDTVPPVAVCRPFTVYTNSNGLAVLKADSLDAGSFDLCTDVSVWSASKTRFTCSEHGENEVWLRVEDQYGNRDSCRSLVLVKDTIPPQIRCLDIEVFLDEQGARVLDAAEIDDRSTDNCGQIEGWTLSRSSFSCADIGTQIISLQAWDAFGNESSCEAMVEVRDTVSPVARCQDFELALGPDGEAILTPDLINEQSSDNCGSLTFSLSRKTFLCSDLGPNPVRLYVEDDSGNRNSCEAMVEVVDKNLPILATRNIVVQLDASGRVEVNPAQVDAGSADNCSIDSMWLSQTVFDCGQVGDNLVALFVRDIDGNINDKSAVVTVEDQMPPQIKCPQSTEINTDLDGPGSCTVVLFDNRFDPKDVVDNCGIATIRHDLADAPYDSTLAGAEFVLGENPIEWEIKDLHGNVTRCTFQVTVIDNEMPQARCRDTLMVQLGADGVREITPADLDQGSTDNCALVEMTLDKTSFECRDIGYQSVRLEVVDEAGNRHDCRTVIGLIASEACPTLSLHNSGGPNISDPCTCREDGAFDEEVVIGPTTQNQIWRVKSTTLLDPATFQPYLPGTQFSEIPYGVDSSIYILTGVHLDGLGYTITAESPHFTYDLQIQNRCFYPQPEILGLDGEICLFTEPIPLEAVELNGAVGEGEFLINGQPATILDPMALGTGQHTVTYRFDAGDPASVNKPQDVGCAVTVEKEVEIIETPENLACSNSISISTNASCELEIQPELLLLGNYLCYDDYQVFLGLGNQPVPNPVPAEFAGETLQAIVQHKPSGRVCYGSIELFDVLGPQITYCPPDIPDRFFCTDLDSILNNPATLDSTSHLYTGRPVFEDNCTGTDLVFRDYLEGEGECSEVAAYTIRRVFTATDQFGNASSCEQVINFYQPREIFFPKDTVIEEDCDQPPLAVDAQGNIVPELAGSPYFINGFGDRVSLLSGKVCGSLVSYSDFAQNTCPGQRFIFREWRLFDVCETGLSQTQMQRIQVGDFTAPVISCHAPDAGDSKSGDIPVFSTSPANCLATIQIPEPAVEECSEYEVSTLVYSWLKRDRFGIPLPDSIFSELPGITYRNGYIEDVPVGRHYFIYTVRDACDNVSRDTCAFIVADKIAPVAFCDRDLTVSFGAAEGGRILPRDIDEGSRDNCDGDEIELELRRFLLQECTGDTISRFSEYGEYVEVNCCDIGKLVTVELRVTDRSGNSNSCSVRVLVQDKLRPQCFPPLSVTVDCDEIPVGFDPRDPSVLQQNFGSPSVNDNCEASWEELPPQVELNSCDVGTITRSFLVTDQAGNVNSGACEQRITIRSVHDYRIKFPADAQTVCGMPSADTLELEEMACDMLAVGIDDEVFNVATGAAGCFKIRRTYQVINWCEYNGFSPPRIVSRDVDCNGIPGDRAVWLIRSRSDTVYLDADAEPDNAFPEEFEKGNSCDGQTNPEGYWRSTLEDPNLRSNGFWQYTQFISIYDDVAPRVLFNEPDPFCSKNSSCHALVNYPFRIEENCITDSLRIRVSVDVGQDGTIDFVLPPSAVQGSFPNYVLQQQLDIGSHQFFLEVSDGCGNHSEVWMPVRVNDCLGTAPICRSGIIVELSRLETPVDLNGDGTLDLAMAQVAAEALVASPVMDCSGPLYYRINRVGDTVRADQDTLILRCEDEGIVPVELHAFDQAGHQDFCLTYIEVQNNRDACREIPQGAIYGMVTTETQIPVRNVEVQLSGSLRNMVMTGMDGIYGFEELEEENDYTLTPRLEGRYVDGVSTFDLILIRKHILGTKLLSSPYKILAADANASGNISILDIILLQKLILGIDLELKDSPSWRFVDAAFRFPDRTNPWMTPIPGVININNLDRAFDSANFIALKVGDVNDSVDPLAAGSLSLRDTESPLVFALDVQAEPGNPLIRAAVYGKDLAQLEGYQFALGFNPEKLELKELRSIQIADDHFGVFPESGTITHNWYRRDKALNPDLPLFTLVFRKRAEVVPEDLLSIRHRQLPGEAYSQNGGSRPLTIAYRGQDLSTTAFKMLQNAPNPFRDETRISIFLPGPEKGRLQVFDQQGRMVWDLGQTYGGGWHTLRLRREDLPAGVLWYRFAGEKHTATRKMLLLDE